MPASTASFEFLYAPAKPNNPFEIAKRELIAKIARLQAPVVDVTPQPDQLHDVAEHVRAVAQAADGWLRLIGLEVKSNATVRVNMDLFNGQFENAVDGWAIFECERVGESIREEYDEAV